MPLTLTGGQGIWHQPTTGADVESVAADLTPPGADRLLFWDHSALAFKHLTLGTNLTITGTTIDAAGGGGGVTDHGALTGLSDDDHTQYARLAGRSGGQTLIGGTASGNVLTLQSTSHATRGYIDIYNGDCLRFANYGTTPSAPISGYIKVYADADHMWYINSAGQRHQMSVEPGTIVPFAGSSAPTGYMDCDGAEISRATYAELFSAIGTAWGTGDGSTTFNIPDLRGRTVIGSGTGSGLTARTLAGTGGAETHQLSTGELATHNHTFPGRASGDTGVGDYTNFALVRGATEQALGASNTGSNTAHNNMQPYRVVKWLIKF